MLNSNNNSGFIGIDTGIFFPEKEDCISDLYNSFSKIETGNIKENSEEATQSENNLKTLKFYYLSLLYESNNFQAFYEIVNNISEMLFNDNLKLYIEKWDWASLKDNIQKRYSRTIKIDNKLNNISSNKNSYQEGEETRKISFENIFNFTINFNIDKDISEKIKTFLKEMVDEIHQKLYDLIQTHIEVDSKYYFDKIYRIWNKTFIDKGLEILPGISRVFSVLYISKNNVKELKENCNNEKLDEINKNIAEILMEETDNIDWGPGCYWMDDFVVLLPDIPKEGFLNEEGNYQRGAMDIAHDILKRVRNNTYNYNEKNFYITASIWVSTSSSKTENEWQKLLRSSGHALKVAQGWNKKNWSICHIDDLPESKKTDFSYCSGISKIDPLNNHEIKEVLIDLIKKDILNILWDKHPSEIWILPSYLPIIKEIDKKIADILEERFDIDIIKK